MTYEEAINFLKSHQPMPDTQIVITRENKEWASPLAIEIESLVDKWEEVLNYFMEHPCEESIPLFFNSLGDKDGLEVYQYLRHYLVKFPHEIVIPYFKSAFRSPSPIIRFWAANFAMEIDSGAQDFIEAMLPLLLDSEEDVRAFASSALSYKAEKGYFDWHLYETFLRQAYEKETEEDIKQSYEEIFAL